MQYLYMPKHGIKQLEEDISAGKTVTKANSKRKPRISKKIKHAIDLLLSGECKTQKAAAIRANLTPDHFSRTLNKPHVREFVAQKVRKNIADLSIRASSRLMELMESSSDQVSKDVALKVLAIEGIREPERHKTQVNVNITPGYIIDLSGKPKQEPVDITPGDESEGSK